AAQESVETAHNITTAAQAARDSANQSAGQSSLNESSSALSGLERLIQRFQPSTEPG
ncbi:MAG: hypothetical protein H8E37_12885, partial [Planctomycetes bacterium]|nr:hypothetical protein [Planctomycetota bacterium]